MLMAMAKPKKTLEQWQLDDAERLKKLFSERVKMSQEEFGAKYGIGSQGMVWQYLNGRSPLNLKSAINFASGIGVPVAAISPTLASELSAVQPSDFSPENKSPVTDNWDGVDRRKEPVPDRRKSVIPVEPNIGVHDSVEDLDPERYLQVESFDVRLSAGSGNIEWVPSRSDPVTFRAGWFAFKKLKPNSCKLLYVRGSSMEPILSDGDAVLIDTAQTSVIDGEIYAVLYWDALYIKTLYRIPGGIQLKSENSDHPSFDVRGADLEHLTILGRKVWRGG
jgi:phage repressor protein C with HTH and peptisase S24 domain